MNYYDDKDTIPNVYWGEETLKLYARWKKKQFRVSYYQGAADRIYINSSAKQIIPSNGTTWRSLGNLEVGEEYKLFMLTSDGWESISGEEASYRILTKADGSYFEDENELKVGDNGKWYFLGIPITGVP